MKQFTLVTALATIFISSFAQAETMNCLVAVYRAADMIQSDASQAKSVQIISAPIIGGSVNQEFQVHGETVAVDLTKFDHADLFRLHLVLTTPVADRAPRGPEMVALIKGYLYNDGPADREGWDVKTGPASTRFALLDRQAGAFGFSAKLIAALNAEGKWGKYPFNSAQIELQDLTAVADFVAAQVRIGKMQPKDVVGIASHVSCTREK